ncbi:hypothetical protein M407DRAFT_16837 [Tulasnella calospora MUT 4182]|uniref:Uncharacterized protein n=1 Tax=Tulasnella calospora MUT 4182 TaxID=1051891 RepID=A0A0C3QYG8_9AGAM|nr:hypothetical protein M407DRAFT_16837 [Tulasnella calospora MUT 4182]
MRSSRWLLLLASGFAGATEPEDVKWTSPQSGETFEPGQMITASWLSDQAIISPSFSLCVEVDGGDDCGDAIWPSVNQNESSSTYSMSIIAPNITDQGSFFIKMKSDFGDYYTSPDFDLSPIEPSPTLSSLMPSSTAPVLPSSTSTLANPKDAAGPSHVNPLAIGIPLTMLGMALLGALFFCLTRSRREQRDAGGTTTGLNPVHSATRTVFHPPPVPGVAKAGNLEAGEATFFNVSLNKTTSDLSQVEKAVCGAISAGSAAARPVPVRQQESRQSSEDSSKSQARDQRQLDPVDEDERYTTPPPRTWQRRDSERHGRDRSWALEKQLRRALERESDLQWEIERRELAWRTMHSSIPSPSKRRHESEDYRSCSMHSAPEYYGRHSDFGPDRWPPPSQSRPYAFRRGSPNQSASETSYADPPKYRSLDPQSATPMQIPIPRPPTAASGPRPERYPPPEDDDMHATLTVVSAYCAPSPMIPFDGPSRPTHGAALPSSTAMTELPTSLRAGGRRAQPLSSYYPPRLERTTR